MKFPINLKHFTALLIFILGGRVSCSAQKLLVDTVILKPEGMAQVGSALPEVQCLIVEENDQEIRADVSVTKGITSIRVFPRTAIQEVRRGSRHEMEWAALSVKLDEKLLSGPLDAISERESALRDFLTRYGETSSAEPARQWLARLVGARLLQGEGWVMVDGVWVSPAGKDQALQDRKLRVLLDEIKALAQKKSDNQGKFQAVDNALLAALPDRINEYKSELIYIELIEGARVALGPYRDQLPERLMELLNSQTYYMRDCVTAYFQAAKTLAELAQGKSRDFKVILMPLSSLLDVQGKWPEFRLMLNLLKEPTFDLVMDAAWLDLADDKSGRPSEEAVRIYEQLVSKSAMGAQDKSTILAEISHWQSVKSRIAEANSKHDLPALAALKAPEGARASASEAVATMVARVADRMKEANRLLAEGKGFFDQGDLNLAVDPLKKSESLWSQNPEMEGLRRQCIARMDESLAKRKKKELVDMGAFLTSVWTYDADVKEVLDRTAYYRNQSSYLDDMSWQMLAVIGGGGLVAVFLVRAVAKMISNE